VLKLTVRVLALVLVPGLCAGQTASPHAAATQMVRAAGMPLKDGALPPGMLTVRLVEGAFTRNLADQLVEVEVSGGKIESARTGADGRAQFAHLPIGARVRAWATVGGERLESDVFDMPAEGGIRLLFVAGASAGAALPSSSQPDTAWTAGSPSSALPPGHPPLPPAPAPSTPPDPADSDASTIRAVLLTATIFSFGIVLYRRRR
jgi:hypothetical protein